MLFDEWRQFQGLQDFFRRLFPLRVDFCAGSQFVKQILTE